MRRMKMKRVDSDEALLKLTTRPFHDDPVYNTFECLSHSLGEAANLEISGCNNLWLLTLQLGELSVDAVDGLLDLLLGLLEFL